MGLVWRVCVCVCVYLVALDQHAVHLLEQVLQVLAAQRLDDLDQSVPSHVSDLLEAVPQQNTHLHQDPEDTRTQSGAD